MKNGQINTSQRPNKKNSKPSNKRKNSPPPQSRKIGASSEQTSQFVPVSIEKFSEIKSMPPFMIWEEIKKGKLIARQINNKVHILMAKSHVDSAKDIGNDLYSNSKLKFTEIQKPSEASHSEAGRTGASAKAGSLPALPTALSKEMGLSGLSSQPEIALLLDHLSLAKEENKEILAMAQSSLAQVREITQQIISAKDDLLTAKEEKIKALEEKLLLKDQELNSTKQNLEDLEMLSQTLLSR